MSDIRATATVDATSANRALDTVRAKLVGIEQAHKAAGKAAREQDRATRDLGRNAQNTLKTAGKLGGPLGGITGQLAAGVGMGDGFGRAAVGLTLAATALRAFSVVMERGTENLKQSLEIAGKMREAREAGARGRDQLADRGLAQEDAFRAMLARGGDPRTADEIAARTGSTIADAQEAYAEALRSGPQTAKALLEIAAVLRSRGDVSSLAAGVSAARADPVAMAMAQGGQIAGHARDRLLAAGGRRDGPLPSEVADLTPLAAAIGSILRRGGDPTAQPTVADLAHRQVSIENFSLIRAAEGARRVGQSVDLAARGEAAANAVGVAQDRATAALSPESAAVTALNKTLDQQREVLEKLAASQNVVAAALANLGLLFGGQGSQQQQLNRFDINRARGVIDQPLRGP